MFGSLHMDSMVPRLQSRQVLRNSEAPHKSIKLEMLVDPARISRKLPRRSSFLPENWDDMPQTQSSVGTTKTSRYSYQGVSIVSARMPEKQKRAKKFCTGSAYYGQFNQLGMAGRGVYRFPHGVIYDGYFNSKGEFHGTGILVYPGGQRVEGLWRNGKLMEGGTTLVSHDNSPNSRFYCKMPDRRFQIEVENDMRPAGQEYLTNSPVPRPIPPGMYDTGEGFYDPIRRVIIDYHDLQQQKTVFEAFSDDSKFAFNVVLHKTFSEHEMEQVMRHKPASMRRTKIECIPTEEREEWIIQNCRKAWDEPVGYRNDFYEIWTPGYKKHNLEHMVLLSRLQTHEMDTLVERLSQLAFEKSSDKVSNVYSFIKNVKPDILSGSSRRGTPRSVPSTPDRYSFRGRRPRRLRGAVSPRITSYGLKPFMFLFADTRPTITHVRTKDDQVEVV